MLYNSHNLEVAKYASKSNPALTGVFFTSKKTCATDGFRLLEVSVDSEVSPADYPRVNGKIAMRGCKPFLLSADVIKKIKLPKQSTAPQDYLAISHLSEDTAEVLIPEDGAIQTKQIRRVDDKFPDYEQIIPKGELKSEIIINGSLLSKLLDAMSKMDNLHSVKIKIYGNESPILLESSSKTQQARGVLMPMKGV